MRTLTLAWVPGWYANWPSVLATATSMIWVSYAPAASMPVRGLADDLRRPPRPAASASSPRRPRRSRRASCSRPSARGPGSPGRARPPARSPGRPAPPSGRRLGEVVRRGHPDAAPLHHANLHPGVLAPRVLVDRRAREPGEPAPLVDREDLDVVGPLDLEGRARDLAQVVGTDRAGHLSAPRPGRCGTGPEGCRGPRGPSGAAGPSRSSGSPTPPSPRGPPPRRTSPRTRW